MFVTNILKKKACLTAISLALSSLVITPGHASDYDKNWRQPVNDWSAGNNNGVLYVHGTLTQNTCRLSMDSAYQAINLGNISTADLKKVGDRGRSVEFNIELLDCMQTVSALRNYHTGAETWSTMQPAVKMSFLSPTLYANPNLIQVVGAKGFGLELSSTSGKVLPIGQQTAPRLLNINSNVLTYAITPVRVSSALEPGQFHAVVTFELVYD